MVPAKPLKRRRTLAAPRAAAQALVLGHAVLAAKIHRDDGLDAQGVELGNADDRLLLDARTLLPGDDDAIEDAVAALGAPPGVDSR